ncbi:GntR family transcriptional regulator [Oxalobacteraceae bacterium R-40]|uniref:GntR family transcriptional regulator n=1 Tax=Keguizhuia sedimenti TaxID=3064264 RepID=A0ABU1BQF0_9BURK|nr:GntR family transcriptional regulator [Oxalobacteraceae bacterium R-40]
MNSTSIEKSPTFSPLYQQIKMLIMQGLQSGEWKPGELIPSEMDLAVRFKVSQGTVRKAIDELSSENLLVRRQGKGTFVATHHEPHVQFRFLRLKPDVGEASYPQNRIIELKRLRASSEIAQILDIKLGDPVVYFYRLQSFEGVPTMLDEIWLPGSIFKGLSAKRLEEHAGSMYSLFETEFNTRMIRAVEKVRAVLADERASELLRISRNSPLLSVERVAYTYADQPVEFRRGLYITEHFHYFNELT